jgi:hypothetical protein
MASSGMLRRVALVRTDVSEGLSTTVITGSRICEKGTTQAVTSSVHWLLVRASIVPSSWILVALMKEALSSSETSVLTKATRRNILEDSILHSHHCENLKSYGVFSIATSAHAYSNIYNGSEGDFSSKTENFMFTHCSVVNIFKSNKPTIHRYKQRAET